MTKYLALPDGLYTIANRQGGAVSRRQYLAAGVSDAVIERLIRHGDARRLAYGVVALRQDNWLQTVWAGLLLGGEGAVVGGMAAAKMNGLLEAPPPIIDIYAPNGRVPHIGPWRFHRSHRAVYGYPPHTGIDQTFVDLAGTIPDDQMMALLATADYKVNTAAVLTMLAHYRRHQGRDQLTRLITDFDGGVRSVLEYHYAILVERPHKLPVPTRQGKPLGTHPCDVLYEQYKLIIELDGRQFHEGLVASRDSSLDNRHLLAGYTTMRFGWSDVNNSPCRTANQIADALAARGWAGRPKKCPNCAP